MRRPLEIQGHVKHLLVDLDGTLLGANEFPLQLDFVRKALRSIRELGKGAGGWLGSVRALRAVRNELSRPFRGTGTDQDRQTNEVRAAAVFSRALGVPLAQGEAILRDSMAQLFPTLSRHFFPMPGAREFLDWAREHYELTLATNPVWPIQLIKLRLEWAGVDPGIFGLITHSGIMHATKPSVDYYRETLAHLAERGLSPRDFLLIGNDVRQDLPAMRAGVPVFIVTPPRSRRSSRPDRPVAFASARGEAPAWRGPFSVLREMLEKNQANYEK